MAKDEKPATKTERLGFRADPELAARVNDLMAAMQHSPQMRGVDVNTTVALKMLVRRALPLAELEYEGFIQDMTPEEEGRYLLEEIRLLVLQALMHPGIDGAGLHEIAELLESQVEFKSKRDSNDPDEKKIREIKERRLQEARERYSS